MNDNRKEIVFVIGRSTGIDKTAMLNGLNTVIEKQKKIKDESTCTLVFFDDEMKVNALCKPFGKMRKFTSANFTVKGRSALYDAIGTAMDSVGEMLSEDAEEKRPSQVCVIVIGEADNASTNYERAIIDEMIKRQKYIYKWDFILYTNADTGFDIGKGGSLDNYEKMFDDINSYVSSLRGMNFVKN